MVTLKDGSGKVIGTGVKTGRLYKLNARADTPAHCRKQCNTKPKY